MRRGRCLQANNRSRCGARPFQIRNQLVFSSRFSEDPESPGVDIEQKHESFVVVLGKEDRPGLGKKFALRLTILDDREMVSLHLDSEPVVLRTVPPGEHAEERRGNLNGGKPRIISDNGPQFIAKDFKEFIRISGMTHVRTSPYYPQSNGKIERWHKSLKRECIRPGTPLSLEDARRLVEGYVEHYNNVRLNSAIGYIAPKDMLAGHQQEIQAERDRKLEAARKQRQIRRQQAA